MKPASSKQLSILLVPGSTRGGSTNVAALRAARDSTAGHVTAELYEGLADLPAFNPDDDHEPLPQAVAALRERIASADGILFCTPEYAGALPGSFKNLLDWTVGGPEMDGKPVAWINVAAEGRGLNAQQSLKTVLGYLGTAVIEPAGRRVVVPRDAVDVDGTIRDERVRAGIADAVRAFADQLAVADVGAYAPRGRRPTMQLRVARHTERLDEVVGFYRDGIGLSEIGGFRDHEGYDGVFLAVPGTDAHLELTAGGGHGAPAPHPESLLVLYLGADEAVREVAARLGVDPIPSANPYWAEHGVTFQDPDGFRVVLVPERWER